MRHFSLFSTNEAKLKTTTSINFLPGSHVGNQVIENSKKTCWLVVLTILKHINQLGVLFPVDGKIKTVPNHQPENKTCDLCPRWLFQSQNPPTIRCLQPALLLQGLGEELSTPQPEFNSKGCWECHAQRGVFIQYWHYLDETIWIWDVPIYIKHHWYCVIWCDIYIYTYMMLMMMMMVMVMVEL